jgi:SIR2-like domain
MPEVVHNLDRHMADLRQILAQGKKRVGLLLGAGAPLALKVSHDGELDLSGEPLIPDVAGLTKQVRQDLSAEDRSLVDLTCAHLGNLPTIEQILSQIRLLARAIGSSSLHSYNAEQYEKLAQKICDSIGRIVNKTLPDGPSAYTYLAAWVGGISRRYAVEIFTPNYDMLLEEAFERALIPYFDGFAGANRPFFDAAAVANDDLPSRWARIWKLHGSLGWMVSGDRIVRAGGRTATHLIYPDHLKYDRTKKLPYAALFDRLRAFVSSADTLMITCGFSYSDAHITSVIEEALSSTANAAVFAFQYKCLKHERPAVELALRRPNLSVYARDAACVNGARGQWYLGEPPSEEWREIRKSYWVPEGQHFQGFGLGDFRHFATFFAQAQAQIARGQETDPDRTP